MATINASTKHTIKKKAPPKVATKKKTTGGTTAQRRGSVAPALKPKQLADPAKVASLQGELDQDVKKNTVLDLYRQATGAPPSALSLSTPHASSTTRDRSHAAADLAVAAKHLGVAFVLKKCGILNELQRTLFPEGIETLLTRGGGAPITTITTDGGQDENKSVTSSTLKPSTSAVSLSSLVDESVATSVANSNASDSKRGKLTPPTAREGVLLILRALCEIIGKPVEPFIVGAFIAASLDECASANSAVREAAEDTSIALINIAHPWSFRTIVCPILLQSFQCPEWRVKAAALERLAQVATLAPTQVHPLIPTLIPAITNQVWDTKAQVSKGARAALLAVCQTNTNRDIKPTIPAVVNAICKPADTNKAVSELMGTTFVVPVDASTLAILCPVLARALKEKLAVHKRAACIVISNMSKLVEKPSAVAPFGSLLVPELQKVAANVQFEEIRDESLKALENLTKALGDRYRDMENGEGNVEAAVAAFEEEQHRVEEERQRIEDERLEEARKEEEQRKKEEEERRKFKEAMDAQRRLEEIERQEEEAKKAEEKQKKEMQKLSTKSAGGKCQACGLKKCKKSCMFYSGK